MCVSAGQIGVRQVLYFIDCRLAWSITTSIIANLRLQQRTGDVVAILDTHVEGGTGLEGRACIDRDSQSLEVLIEGWVKVDRVFARANDEVVWPWLHKVHEFERVGLDFTRVYHVPHEVAIWEDDYTARDPVVIDEEVSIREAINFHTEKQVTK